MQWLYFSTAIEVMHTAPPIEILIVVATTCAVQFAPWITLSWAKSPMRHYCIAAIGALNQLNRSMQDDGHSHACVTIPLLLLVDRSLPRGETCSQMTLRRSEQELLST